MLHPLHPLVAACALGVYAASPMTCAGLGVPEESALEQSAVDVPKNGAPGDSPACPPWTGIQVGNAGGERQALSALVGEHGAILHFTTLNCPACGPEWTPFLEAVSRLGEPRPAVLVVNLDPIARLEEQRAYLQDPARSPGHLKVPPIVNDEDFAIHAHFDMLVRTPSTLILASDGTPVHKAQGSIPLWQDPGALATIVGSLVRGPPRCDVPN